MIYWTRGTSMYPCLSLISFTNYKQPFASLCKLHGLVGRTESNRNISDEAILSDGNKPCTVCYQNTQVAGELDDESLITEIVLLYFEFLQ